LEKDFVDEGNSKQASCLIEDQFMSSRAPLALPMSLSPQPGYMTPTHIMTPAHTSLKSVESAFNVVAAQTLANTISGEDSLLGILSSFVLFKCKIVAQFEKPELGSNLAFRLQTISSSQAYMIPFPVLLVLFL
jgi:hypothetical protein